MKTFLDLVKSCDCFPYDKIEQGDYWTLHLPGDDRIHGLMRPDIVERMPWTGDFHVQSYVQQVVLHANKDQSASNQLLSAHITNSFAGVVDRVIQGNLFEMVHQRHSEPYRILGARVACQIERFTHSLFGIVARGAHLTAYVRSAQGLKIWVPRRASNLFTYPGKLDNTVAGGVKARDSPLQCISEEAMEEASLPAHLVEERIVSVGTLSYITQYDSPSKRERNLISPEILYVYDMEVPQDVVLTPCDDEVQEFHLMPVRDVVDALRGGDFKTNSAVVLIDFFVRHGLLTEENEPDYVDIVTRLHRRLELATMPQS